MKKMKKVISILLILTFAVSLAACGGGGQTADNGEYITVTDHLDKEVQVPANAERIQHLSNRFSNAYAVIPVCSLRCYFYIVHSPVSPCPIFIQYTTLSSK